MVAMVMPLHVIETKFVKRALIISSVLLICMAIGKWVLFYLGNSIDVSKDMIREDLKTFNRTIDFDLHFIVAKKPYIWKILAHVQLAESFNVLAMVIIVAVCSAVTAKSLSSPIVEVMEPGGVVNNAQNRRATIMVLLLSLAFVVINSAWVVMFAQFYGQYLGQTLIGQDSGIMTLVTLTIMPANSVVNPLIYMFRNAELHDYTKTVLTKPVHGLIWILIRGLRGVVACM